MNRFSTSTVLLTALILGSAFTGVSCAQKKAAAAPEASTPPVAMEAAQTPETAPPDPQTTSPEAADLGESAEKNKKDEMSAEQNREREQNTAERARFEAEIIPFEFDSAGLNETAKERLREKAAWMAANPDIAVTIEGHCDIRGTEPYNQNLGAERAEAVKAYLASLGIQPQRMNCVSFGEAQPLTEGTDRADHQKNRRARIKIDSPPEKLTAS